LYALELGLSAALDDESSAVGEDDEPAVMHGEFENWIGQFGGFSHDGSFAGREGVCRVLYAAF
jgi:hypothetical protein